jgi:hypothetical protein
MESIPWGDVLYAVVALLVGWHLPQPGYMRRERR